MTDEHKPSERERLDELRESVAVAVEAAEFALESQTLLEPALDWLEDLKAQLQEHEDLLLSDEGDEPLETEETEELCIWAESFSDCLNDGDDIEDECIPDDLPAEVTSALSQLLAHFLNPVRQSGWKLYHVSIRAA